MLGAPKGCALQPDGTSKAADGYGQTGVAG